MIYRKLRHHSLTLPIFNLVPGEPTGVRVSSVNSTTIHVSWKPPSEKDRNGIIRGYHIHIHEVKDEVRDVAEKFVGHQDC